MANKKEERRAMEEEQDGIALKPWLGQKTLIIRVRSTARSGSSERPNRSRARILQRRTL